MTKTKAQLTTTLNQAITDNTNQENTSTRVRAMVQDIIDASLNENDGGYHSGTIPAYEFVYGNGAGNVASSDKMFASGADANIFTSITRPGGVNAVAGYSARLDSSNAATFLRYGDTTSGNILLNNVIKENALVIQNSSAGTEGNGTVAIVGNPILAYTPGAYGMRLDGAGLTLGPRLTINTPRNPADGWALAMGEFLVKDDGRSMEVGSVMFEGTTYQGFFNKPISIYSSSTFAAITLQPQPTPGALQDGSMWNDGANLFTVVNSSVYCLTSGSTGGGVSSAQLATKANLSGATFTGTVNASAGLSASTIQSSSMTSTGTTRMVQVSSAGTLSASVEIISSWVSDSTIISALTNVANWSGVGACTGTVTGLYQGQQYYDSNYYFVAVSDNTPIRMLRG